MEPPPSYADALTAKQHPPPQPQPPQPSQPQPHYYVPEAIIIDACPHPQLETPAETSMPSSVRLFIVLLRVFILIIIVTLFVFTTIRVVKYLAHS